MFIFHLFVGLCSVSVAVNALTVLTYNAGLLEHAEDNRDERREKIAEGLRDVDADVVCLQEVWLAEDLTKLTLDLQDVYPYSFSELHSTGNAPPLDAIVEPACSQDTFGPFMACFAGNKCTGLAVLSKHRMTSTTYTAFHPGYQLFLMRGYIHAQVDNIGSVTCTHPSAIFPYYMEPQLQGAGLFDNYKDQNAAEIEQLVTFVKQSGHSPILLGDFNIGPALSDMGIVAEHEDNYNLMLTAPFLTTLLTKCTYCSDNSYINGSYADIVVDHVFYNNHKVLDIQRVLDKETLPSNGHHLSDHYGVLVTFFGHTAEKRTPTGLTKEHVMLIVLRSLFCFI